MNFKEFHNREICIAFLLDFYFEKATSLIPRIERHFSHISRYFQHITVVTVDERNYQGIFVNSRNLIHLPLFPLRVPHLLRGLLGIFLGVTRLVTIFKSKNDIILFSSTYSIYPVLVSLVLKIPLIVHFKYEPPIEREVNFKNAFKRGSLNLVKKLSLKSANIVVVTTPYLKRTLVANNVGIEKVFVVPNYVDEDLFSPKIDGRLIRERLFVDRNEKIVSYIGRLRKEKGLNDLIEAFSIICIRFKHVKLIILGEGKERGQFENQCKKYGIWERVYFIGSIPNNLVPNFLAASDVVVLPSYSEGHPKSLIEAMMMARPIVGTDIVGINQIVTHGKEAILVKPKDPYALSEGLKLILENEQLAQKIGLNARKKALRKYSKKTILKIAEINPLLIVGF